MPGVDDVSEHGLGPDEKLVYIAGPYTNGDWGSNISRAIEAAQAVLDLGHVPFVPHTMTGLWSINHDNDWIAFDLKWLEQCDAMIRLNGHSNGADSEVEFAEENGIDVFESVTEFHESVGTTESSRESIKATETQGYPGVDTDTTSGLLTGGK